MLIRHALLLIVAATFAASGAQAQTWPDRPIKIIVPFPAGGQLDIVVRLLAEKIAPELGQSIVVENRTGADGNIGAEFVARSAADGDTWLATSVPFATQVTLRPKTLHYDPVRDFEPVANMGSSSFVLVVPAQLPVHSVKEFIAYANAHRGELSYGGTSAGSVTHLSTEMFKRATGVEMQMIPYAGIPPALTDLLAGRIQFMSLGLIAALPHIKSGKLRPLAILDGTRHKLLPDVPTIGEEGYPQVIADTWFGLLMPAHTPSAIVARVNTDIVKAMQSSDVIARYASIGVDPAKPHTPADFGAQLKGEIARWAKVVKDSNVSVE